MNLFEYQKKYGLSDKELAEKINIHVSFISHIRAGRKGVSPKMAVQIEQALNHEVTCMELLYPTPDK